MQELAHTRTCLQQQISVEGFKIDEEEDDDQSFKIKPQQLDLDNNFNNKNN